MFKDRNDAGIRLAKALEGYRDQNILVLAIPRGGVEVGYHVAKYLNADFSVIISRKLAFPDNPEAGFGAVAEDGSVYIIEQYKTYLSSRVVAGIIEQQRKEIQRRIAAFRNSKPLPPIAARQVILVDDGIAMGSTMRASLLLCRNQKARKVIVAAPVSGIDTARMFRAVADDVVILETPFFFYAVAQAYEQWYDLPDSEVLEILHRWQREKAEKEQPNKNPEQLL